jgi:dTDP-4-dehydrorhamnose 3,5-epimerase
MTELRRVAISAVVEVVPPKHGDHRGYFSEVFKRSAFEAEGLCIGRVQDNQSFSAEAGTVRGLYFQTPPFAQAKLIRVLRGAVFDLAVDIRRGSSTFGRWVAAELSADKWNQLFVPAGFANGFMTLTPDVEVLFKVDAPWARESERTIRWNDPDIAIAWPRPGDAILSGQDGDAPSFRDLNSPVELEAD